MPTQSSNVNLHSSHLKRQDYVRPRQDLHFACSNTNLDDHRSCLKCDSNKSSSQLSLFPTRDYDVGSKLVRRNESFTNNSLCHNLQQCDIRNVKPLQKRISLSQDSLGRISIMENVSSIPCKTDLKRSKIAKGKNDHLKLNNRISKSEDCLNDLQKDLQKFKQNPEMFQKNVSSVRISHENFKQDLSYISSDDEYLTDTTNLNDTMMEYDGTSQSSYSITTEANGDFDFYQNNYLDDAESIQKNNEMLKLDKNRVIITVANSDCYEIINNNIKNEFSTFKQTPPKPKSDNFTEEILARCTNTRNSKNFDINNFRITRSNSKRSLENFQAYIEVDYKIPRSNSFVAVEKKHNSINNIDKFDYRLINNLPKKFNASSDNLNNFRNMNTSATYLDNSYSENEYRYEPYNHDINSQSKEKNKLQNYGGSVPDFKKVFISEYI